MILHVNLVKINIGFLTFYYKLQSETSITFNFRKYKKEKFAQKLAL